MTKLKPGDQFAFLTILEPHPGPRKAWLCSCECGARKVILGQHLKSGSTQSCGCLRRAEPAARTHGMSRHPAYLQYRRMVALCKTYTRVPRLANKKLGDFRDPDREPSQKSARRRFPRAKYDFDGQLILPEPPPPKPKPLLERYGYVQRPIPVMPDVATFELFWAAMGPTWFPGARLSRRREQPYAPHPALDAGSAMCVDNLKWVPK